MPASELNPAQRFLVKGILESKAFWGAEVLRIQYEGEVHESRADRERENILGEAPLPGTREELREYAAGL